MVTIVVQEEAGCWRIVRDGELFGRPDSRDEAMILALSEASRTFETGEAAEVVVREG